MVPGGTDIFSSWFGYMNIAKVFLETPLPTNSSDLTTQCGVALRIPPECI